jgi:CBS domain-containing protein
VLYALHAADFELLLPRYPRATQYVAAHSAVTADYQAPGERLQPHEIFLADLLGDRAPLQCLASTPICEAARLLNESGSQALALATEGGQLAALLTPADLLRWIAAGAANPEQPARAIAPTILVTVAPQISVADCVLAMAEARSNAAAVASEASPHAAIHNIVTAPILAPAFGDHPSNILQEIAYAPRIEALGELNERARAWILQSLVAPSALDWLASFADLVNRRILELWCFYGAAGRRELLTLVAPSIAVIGDAPASLHMALAECGYFSPEPLAAGSPDEWKARFSGWIGDPIRTQVYHSRPFFDLRPVQGPERLFQELQSHIRAELDAEPSFLRILAHDCLANLPPLTFFRDLVVEDSGEQTETFRLESSALQPLADVARVFGLAYGTPLGGSTRTRFEQARAGLPSHESIFHEAAETMRVVLFHQARAGLRLRSSGATLPLSILSRHDRQVLKSGFRSIHDLLEFTAPCDWLEAL